jgi:metal-sulfur cluster biosynthetic enzyme
MADTMEKAPTLPAPDEGGNGQTADLRAQIEAQLATCRDPEIGLDIMSLGLVYETNIEDGGNVLIKMTLTAIGCPWAQDLFDEVKMKVEEVPGVNSCTVELVYSPPWSADMMSDDAKMELGFL